jgi:hypothetical protein
MWMRSTGGGPDLTLRTGVALVGLDAEALWVDCCAAAKEHLPFESVVAAVLGSGRPDNRIWNIVADAIDVRVMAQGFAPLYSSRPVIDLG